MSLDIEITSGFLEQDLADRAWDKLIKETNWQQDTYNFGGRKVLAPRLTALYGDKDYVYSGMKKTPEAPTESVKWLLNKVQTETLIPFNSVLLNFYRNGKDSIGFHSDDEPEHADTIKTAKAASKTSAYLLPIAPPIVRTELFNAPQPYQPYRRQPGAA